MIHRCRRRARGRGPSVSPWMPHLAAAFTVGTVVASAAGASPAYPTRRALTSEAQVKALRGNPKTQAEARKLRKQLHRYLEMSYEQLWQFIPPAKQLRAVNVAFNRGCPICGREIFREKGHYPWIRSSDRPFKVQCPICKTVFPSNDFKPWTTARGQLKPGPDDKYLDDGFGYINEKGEPFYFVAYYVFWQLWRGDIPNAVSGLSRLYLISGDLEAGRRAVILLSKLATEYPRMHYQTQSVHIGKWPSGYAGKICDYVWENSSASVYPTAYDNVRDLLADSKVGAFLSTKGIDDAHAHIFKRLLQGIIRAYLNRNIHGNMGWQRHLMHAVRAINNDDPRLGHTTREMVDWLLYGGGELAVLLYNGVTRDGAGSEGSPGYNGMWWSNLRRVAAPMKRLGFDMWRVPPWAPRLKKMSDYYLDLIVAEKYIPSIGDCGNRMQPKTEITSPGNFRAAYEATGDLRFLRQLRRYGEDVTPLLDKLDEPARKRFLAEPEPLLWSPRTRDVGGYGLAVLESGRSEHARGVAMYYGSQGAWHDHKDRLNIEYIARDTSYLPEMGYPAHWGDKAYEWTMATTSHYTVLIDERGHRGKPEGWLHLLADGAWARVMEASAERLYPDRAKRYRRTVAMIDVGEADSYLVDVFRVVGGRQHDYSFHGLPWADVKFDGLTLGPEHPGTVAGEKVPFGERPKANYHGSGYYYLAKPRHARPAGDWRVTWQDRRDPKQPRALRLHVPASVCQELIVAQAEPELDPGNPRQMDWLLLRNRAVGDAPAASTYLGVIEPLIEQPLIQQVERLTSRDPETARKAGWVGLRVRHLRGVDVVCSALDERILVETTDGVRFQGRFGVVRQGADGRVRRYLVNGHLLAAGDSVVRGNGPVRARISRVLHRDNAVEITPPLTDPAEFVGRVAIVYRDEHRTSYTIRSASTVGGHTRLGFGDVTCIIGIVEIDSPGGGTAGKDAAPTTRPNEFTTSTRLSGYGIKFAGVSIVGLSAVSEDMKVIAPIVARSGGTFTLGDGATVASFKDADGDGRRMVYLSDLSVGEEVVLPTITDVSPASAPAAR